MTFCRLFSFHKVLLSEAMKKINVDMLDDEEKLLLAVLEAEDFIKLKLTEEELIEIYKKFSLERKLLIVTMMTKRMTAPNGTRDTSAVRDFGRFVSLVKRTFPTEDIMAATLEYIKYLKEVFNKKTELIDINEFDKVRRLKGEYDLFGYDFFKANPQITEKQYEKLEEKFGV